MPSSTVEDYIKRLYLEQQRAEENLVPFGRLAAAMNVVPGTVTTMVKALADSNLVAYEPRQGVRLTSAGEKLALHVLRRHRLLELFLVKVLHLDWTEVHAEAEQLEHAISDRVLERIDTMLGQPGFDPHGDPIPSAAGTISEPNLQLLSSAQAGQRGAIARIIDQDADFLRYATEHGLMPGTEMVVESNDAIGDSITLVAGRKKLNLGRTAAGKILISCH